MTKNIKTRLYSGFATAVFLVLMIGIISYATFIRQTNEAARVKHSYQVINQLEALQNLMTDMETGRRGFRSTNVKKFLEPYSEAVIKIKPVLTNIRQLLNDNPEQLNRLTAVEKSIDGLLAFWKINGDNASQYTREKITLIADGEKSRMDQFRKQIDEIRTNEQQLLLFRENANTRSINLATTGLIIGVLLIVLIVAVLIYNILKHFKSRTKAEAELQKNNGQLVELNDATAEKNWLLAGLAEVNNSLQGVSYTTQLCEKFLSKLVAYIKADAGAFYLYNTEADRLELVASIALPSTAKKVYMPGEDFVGSAVTQTTPVVIKNIPSKYIVPEGGAIQAGPVEGMYTALYLDNELKGVYELLKIKSFENKHTRLLNLIDNNIVVAINSAQAREKVMLLLEKVQQQKEELENQQEELRQINEELSLQTEVLQSSEEELRVQEEELRQINAELVEKNETVETARQALALKAKEMESSNQYKTEFLANMSHELRTPLNSVLILAKLLSSNSSNNLTQKQLTHANIIYKSGSDLLRLINDILDLSKIEAGKVDLNIEDVRLTSIANDMEQLFNVVAEEKGIHFGVDISENLPATISTDKQRVEQVLKNLLSNSLKFTPRNGNIALRFEKVFINEVPVVSISVTDTGIGISGSKQQLVFEAFQQADGSTSRKYGGTGLGLSITKELVRILGGQITLKSQEGNGSTFTIILPFEKGHNIEQPVQQVVLRPLDALPGIIEEQQLVADDREEIQPGNKVMLIVEDDQVFASIIRDLAREKGYKTLVAIKGDEGLHYAQKYKPDAIILDMKLPVIDGAEVLKTLKSSEELEHIPVHIVSAADENTVDSSTALAFLKKPVKKEDIENAFTVIEEYLHSSVRKVLLFLGDNLKDNVLQQLFDMRHFDIKFDFAGSVDSALQMLAGQNYDCIIADIGSNIEAGILNLNALRTQLSEQKVPLIIYLDNDLSANDEKELKKVSEAIVRKSSSGYNRLMDEVELFLYKLQNTHRSHANFMHKQVINGHELRGKKVLIVDDDMRNVFALTAVLENEEMIIITGSDGKDGLDALKKDPGIDIVLMDIMMPEMDGYQAMRHIRNDLKLTQLPIIALTAKAMSGDREKCIKAGASDYITKPVDAQKLVSLIRVWIS